MKSFGTRVRAGQGSDDPFSLGRSGSAGPPGLPLVLLIAVAGVIITHAAHRRLTGWHWLTALAGGVNRDPGPIGRTAPVVGLGVGFPGSGPGRQPRVREAGWPWCREL